MEVARADAARRRRRRREERGVAEAVRGVGEGARGPVQVREEPQQLVVREEALLEHEVEEDVVALERVVDGPRLVDVGQQIRVARLDDLEHGVVHQILREVEHARVEVERAAEVAPRAAVARPVQVLRRHVARPDAQEPPLEALRAEQVAEDELVLDDGPAAQHDRRGPRRRDLQHERVGPEERRREARVAVVVGGVRVDRVEVVLEPPRRERRRQLEAVQPRALVARAVQAQRQAQQVLEPRHGDLVRRPVELVVREVHEVHEEVALAREEELLEHVEVAHAVAALEQERLELDGRGLVADLDGPREVRALVVHQIHGLYIQERVAAAPVVEERAERFRVDVP